MQDITSQWRALGDDAMPHLIRSSGYRIVGIAGAPGAGKSTIARRIPGAFAVSLDDYYLSKSERAARGLPWRGPPGTHDVDAVVAMLGAVRRREAPITVQRFSPAADDRIEPLVLDATPDVLIVEGWVLGHRADGYDAILDRLDVLVFVDVPVELARERRFAREASLREQGGGFAEEQMKRFWDEVLEPGLNRWVRDAKEAADIVIEMDADGVRAVRATSEVAAALK
jgi:pantothenate kinase-related protein Tda10